MLKQELHTLYLMPLAAGPVFTVDQQEMWDPDQKKFIDGQSLGCLSIEVHENREITIRPHGYLAVPDWMST